ncbi:hypothetical protein BDW69DRAFT_59386 [Aspergillus filifer]
MLGTQVNLLWYILRVEKANVKYVFYNTDTRRAGRYRCLTNTMRWIRKLLSMGMSLFLTGLINEVSRWIRGRRGVRLLQESDGVVWLFCGHGHDALHGIEVNGRSSGPC